MSSTITSIPTYNTAAARQRSRQARAAQAAQAAEREQSKAAAQQRLLTLMTQLANRTIDQLPTQQRIEELSEKGHGSVLVTTARPPTKREEVIDGEVVQVPEHPADQTHFAGYKGREQELKEPTDHAVNGVPIVALMQGFRPKGAKAADPKTLPRGMVLADWLNERLVAGVENPEDAMCVQTIWNGKHKQVELHLVWDLEAWNKWRSKVERIQKARRQQREQQRERERAQGPTRSMDQFLADQQAAKERAQEEFTEVRARRRANRSAASEAEEK